MKRILLDFLMQVAIRCLQKAHKCIEPVDEVPMHEFAEDICSHIQKLDYMRLTYGKKYKRLKEEL